MFWPPLFNAFAIKVREAAQESSEDDRVTAIEKVTPEVSEKLRSLTAYQLAVDFQANHLGPIGRRPGGRLVGRPTVTIHGVTPTSSHDHGLGAPEHQEVSFYFKGLDSLSSPAVGIALILLNNLFSTLVLLLNSREHRQPSFRVSSSIPSSNKRFRVPRLSRTFQQYYARSTGSWPAGIAVLDKCWSFIYCYELWHP
ncbi:hypothetical protein N657DRAFT_104790 [Parathielavia appendiculata]|uniref:Uncharacterized protein n=1 Tax=Parathielavia appendiculata TaxID=2587402 RepID=A0AAN6TY98_9PEZI|nr:hypothetical protein N657DRAFT_104790 [Parathielavia appendiculata]